MNLIARGFFWWLDYVYVTIAQARHVFGRDASRFRRGDRLPVVLLPGVYETWQFLLPVAEELHRRGHPIHVVRRLGYNVATIPAAAEVVAAYLEEEALADVVLVAHSKGGLIGKQLMAAHDPDRRIRHLVAVATPFSGSWYARWALVRTIRDFSPRDATLVRLAANLAVNSRITSIFPVFDPHIPGGSELQGATNVKLRTAGHFRILSDKRVLAAVVDAVESAG